MANLLIINILPNRVADIYIKLKNITSKLHNTSASIPLIKKALFLDVIPKFAIVTDISNRQNGLNHCFIETVLSQLVSTNRAKL